MQGLILQGRSMLFTESVVLPGGGGRKDAEEGSFSTDSIEEARGTLSFPFQHHAKEGQKKKKKVHLHVRDKEEKKYPKDLKVLKEAGSRHKRDA